ncbi:MAG: DeoR/GlpR transcriptional regulator [Firmicutes bacterium]|nr:DeoR/GlpR transcriptional regulator [Bacillota bacterium]
MLPAERRAAILQMLKTNGSIQVAELSKLFNVSEGTIRRDLDQMSRKGLLEKTYGGAMSIDSTGYDPPFAMQKKAFAEEKERIGRAAAQGVKDGETVFIEAGTTTLCVARNLRGKKNLLVVTNGIDIAAELQNDPDISIMLTGGDLRKHTAALVGPYAEQVLDEVRVDKAFLGVSAITSARGMSTGSVAEAQIKKAIIRAARHVTAVIDHSKFGKEAFAFVAPVTVLHKIVTDDKVPEEELKVLRERGIEVAVV